MFNFLTVALLLPLEAASKYLARLSGWFISLSPGLTEGSKPPDMLKALTKPFTKAIISVDKKLISKIAEADTDEEIAALDGKRMLKKLFSCEPKTNGCTLSDTAAGVIVLIGSLTILCITLMVIVKTLKSLLRGRVAVMLHRTVNGNVPDLRIGSTTVPMAWLSGYVAIFVGMLVTLAVQSSSITTSALTPLVGVGVVKLERMYPTVLGANIGTCITGVLAALAADASKLYLTLQVAYAHLLFNITGILIFYCVWPLRALPINAAKFLGDTTAEYRWFALAYILVAFFLIPIVFLAFSLAGTACFVVMISITLTIALIVVVINVLQRFKPSVLPAKLRTWEFLPKYMRSLEPMDRLVCLPLIANVVKMCPRFAGKMGVEAKDVPVVKVTTSSTYQKPEPVQSSSA